MAAQARQEQKPGQARHTFPSFIRKVGGRGIPKYYESHPEYEGFTWLVLTKTVTRILKFSVSVFGAPTLQRLS